MPLPSPGPEAQEASKKECSRAGPAAQSKAGMGGAHMLSTLSTSDLPAEAGALRLLLVGCSQLLSSVRKEAES